MISKCRKWHLRGTYLTICPERACPWTTQEARAFAGAPAAPQTSLSISWQGWNLCVSLFKTIITQGIESRTFVLGLGSQPKVLKYGLLIQCFITHLWVDKHRPPSLKEPKVGIRKHLQSEKTRYSRKNFYHAWHAVHVLSVERSVYTNLKSSVEPHLSNKHPPLLRGRELLSSSSLPPISFIHSFIHPLVHLLLGFAYNERGRVTLEWGRSFLIASVTLLDGCFGCAEVEDNPHERLMTGAINSTISK